MRYWSIGYWGIQVAAITAIVLGVSLVGHLMPGLTWMKAGTLSAVTVIGTLSLLSAYRYADEVILQTHKAAWFWGGLFGIVATVPVVLVFLWHLVTIPVLLPHFGDGSSVYFVEGFMLPLLAQMAGFLIVWAYQNLLRRQQ
jgi:hypothetical protein